MHVYLTKAISVNGRNVPTNLLGYRGQAGDNDDPESFKKLMEARGLQVHLSPVYLGEVINSEFESAEN